MGQEPISLPVCLDTWKLRKNRRKMDNIGKIQQMKGQGVGKGREPGEGALAKPLQTQRQDHTWTRLLEKPAEGGREVSVARD